MKPWIIYCRVSSDEQAQGTSMDSQEQACRNLLQAHGHGPIEVVSDPGASGKNLDRPAFGALLRRLERGEIAGLCVYAIDRLTRRNRDLMELVDLFDAQRVELISVRERVDTSGPMGRFVLGLLGSIAQLERETIISRVRSGIAHRKQQGAYLGRPPAGCVIVRDANNIPRLAPEPKTGPTIGECWKLAGQGRTLLEIAAHLDRSGIKTAFGRTWSKTAVASLLASPSVVGVLVDRPTWEAAQRGISRRRKGKRETLSDAPVSNPASTGVWSLSGLCWCSACGSAMVIGTAHGRNGKGYAYLRCSGRLKKGRGYCASQDIPHDALEAVIIQGMVAKAASGNVAKACGEWLANRRASVQRQSKDVAKIQRQRDDLIRRRDAVLDLVEEGGPAARGASERLAALQQELETTEGKLAGMNAAAAILARDQSTIDGLAAAIQHGLPKLPKASAADRAAVLAGFVERIDVSKERALVQMCVPGAVADVLHGCTKKLPRLDSNQE